MSGVPLVRFHDVPLGARPEIITAGAPARTPRLPWTDFPPRDGWVLHIYSYTGQRVYDGHAYDFVDGWASLIPAAWGWREVYPPVPACHVYSRFLLPGAEKGLCRRIPVVWDLAERADRYRRQFRAAVSRVAENRLWAEVTLWELLFELADASEHVLPTAAGGIPAVVRQAQRYVETALGDPIMAEDVAAAVGLSYSHLAALFRKHVGLGIAAYVRERKMAVAEELICNSEMPIKSIAAQIGMTDLQHFSKLVRKAFGGAPRRLRQRCEQQTEGR